MNRVNRNTSSAFRVASRSLLVASLCAGLLLIACSEQSQETAAEPPAKTSTVAEPPAKTSLATPKVPAVTKGMYFKPDLSGFALHNESDEDGDGDGVNETHVRRYINKQGDTAFSMTTDERLWAWSLDTKAGDDSEIRKNFVIRDSNCDGVFDERYGLDAEFRVPNCLASESEPETP
jgi:hypothetical protein